jgi:dolichol-phosphate mannosyltransferase
MKKISVVIPVYNESENIDTVYRQVVNVFEKRLPHYALEIIFTDNCSTDDTYTKVKCLVATDTRVKALQLSRNFGYQASIFTGYMNATGDAVIQMDSDGEDPPEVIPEFVQYWEQGYHVVYGTRVTRQESKIMQWQRNFFYKLLKKISTIDLPPGAGDFRLLDMRVVDTLRISFKERNLYLRGLVSFIGFRQIGLPYHRGKRTKGRSKFSYFDYFRLAWDAITSFSDIPLKIVSLLGLCMAGVAIAGAVFYFMLFAFGRVPVKGFTTLILVILLLSGIQLVCLGIVGEYISRIFNEVKARPRSIIANSAGFEKPPTSA